MLTVYEYPNCSTCKKTKKWLNDQGKNFEAVHIVESTPSKEELASLHEKSGLELKKFFNTSGKMYRELEMKERMKTASEDELLELLASEGMLIKRPIVTDGKHVTVGFKEETFNQTWK
ncbi:arsenate reductase family protein [Pseudalkalibacillus berkeleyi]|uniref:Arsenate reductase family protein n=1 Tax=Pseudalkalibacillus berkeleyi TaxID=1069813 RepID=A0ABS9H3D2_9BACL|nr:arsenate reductase family protein [Pseudalkalibacillus berkeleyi]MCF6138581.1 arsenate reductase family protein [Pseudalkalibacillus berkeleyi]